MRSIIFALTLAAPLSAVAATPTYTNPMTMIRHSTQKERVVPLTFINFTTQEREVRIGNIRYILRQDTVFHAFVPVGRVVSEYSNVNSNINGQEVLRVSESDAGKSVLLK